MVVRRAEFLEGISQVSEDDTTSLKCMYVYEDQDEATP
jgi:hypothetical protein